MIRFCLFHFSCCPASAYRQKTSLTERFDHTAGNTTMREGLIRWLVGGFHLNNSTSDRKAETVTCVTVLLQLEWDGKASGFAKKSRDRILKVSERLRGS